MLDTSLPPPAGYRPVPVPAEEDSPSTWTGPVRSAISAGLLVAVVLAPTGWMPTPLHGLLGTSAALLLPGAVVLGLRPVADRLVGLGGLERAGLTVLTSLFTWIVAGLMAYACTTRASTMATTVTIGVVLLGAACAGADPLRGLRLPASAAAPAVVVLALAGGVTAALLIGSTVPAPASTVAAAIALDGHQATAAAVSGGLAAPPVGVELMVDLRVTNPAPGRRAFTLTATMPWGTVWTPRHVSVPARRTAAVSIYGLVPDARCTTDVTVRLLDADGTAVTGGLTVPVLPRPEAGACPVPTEQGTGSAARQSDGGSRPPSDEVATPSIPPAPTGRSSAPN